ncbi:hypothetical protein FQR65_LT13523 [Abscondita terminalis]|nr:hypothetical protein FQR65_LT13523 [Abscondita terminalis]
MNIWTALLVFNLHPLFGEGFLLPDYIFFNIKQNKTDSEGNGTSYPAFDDFDRRERTRNMGDLEEVVLFSTVVTSICLIFVLIYMISVYCNHSLCKNFRKFVNCTRHSG